MGGLTWMSGYSESGDTGDVTDGSLNSKCRLQKVVANQRL